MRALIFLGWGLMCADVVGAAEAPQLPRMNPSDQMRFIWGLRPHCYTNAVEAGINTVINRFGSGWNGKRDTYAPGSVMRRREFIEMMRADGLDYIEQCNVQTFSERPDLAEKYARVMRNGRLWKRSPDASSPEFMREMCRRAAFLGSTCSNDIQVVGIQTSSEVRDHSRPSFTPQMESDYRAATGCEIPKEANDRLPPHYLQLVDFPASRVIETTYPLFRFYSWWWKKGDGWNDYQDLVGAAFASQFDRPLVTFYDPVVRTPPIRGSGGNDTYISQWTYTYPEPYNVAWVNAEEQAMARGKPGQRVGTMVQLITYVSETCRTGKKPVGPVPEWRRNLSLKSSIITTPPDIVRGGMSAQFWHRMDAVGVYAWEAVWPLPDPEKRTGYPCTNPDTGAVIGEVFNRVGVPLGPLFRAFPEREMEVAYLESAAAALFAGRGTWGWRNPVYRCGVMGYAAHLQPGVLYEEDLAEGGVPASVKVLVCPYCDVLTRPSYEAILAFQKRGGIVVGDRNFVPGILPDLEFPDIRSASYLDPDCGRISHQGILNAAAKFKRDLAPHYLPPADSTNPELVTFVRTQGKTDLLFVQNDRRDYGDYVGPWRMILEKGLPNEGTVTLRRAAGAVYDLVEHRAVPFTVKDGVTEIATAFRNVDVNVYLVTEKPLEPLTYSVSGNVVTVKSADKDVMIPIEVRRAGAKPYYGVVEKGVWHHAFDDVKELAVRDLATGRACKEHPGWWPF